MRPKRKVKRPYKQLGEYLQLTRMDAGYTQRDVSEYLGFVTPQFVSNWERGLSLPPVEYLRYLGAFYHLAAAEIRDAYLEQLKVILNTHLGLKD